MESSSDDRMRSIPELPVHIGIIMDGNGRWAQRRNTIRSAGHREGLQTAKKIVKAASEIGIKYITLYTFSTENWKRAEDEVNFLMRLISQYLKKEYNFYRDNRIRVLHSGDISLLPKFVQRELQEVIQDTRDFGGIVVNLAINYGGRDEIIRSVNRWLAENHDRSAEGISEHDVKTHLDCPDIPDPDLIIRTGGEQRLSNFLLWESAYSEYYFSDKLWPDFCEEDLLRALEDFSHRTRKYGGAH